VIVCDTGPLVAAGNLSDEHFHACTEMFTGLHLAGRQILVPATVIAEAGYLLGSRGGAGSESSFLRSFAEGALTCVGLELADFERMVELVDTYADFPLGTTDASVIALAERLGVSEVATLDRRHYNAVRPRHVPGFTLLP
jgi:predicted nucleic acid-binding protein